MWKNWTHPACMSSLTLRIHADQLRLSDIARIEKDYEDPSHLSAIDVTADGGVRYEGSQERTIDICFICS